MFSTNFIHQKLKKTELKTYKKQEQKIEYIYCL